MRAGKNTPPRRVSTARAGAGSGTLTPGRGHDDECARYSSIRRAITSRGRAPEAGDTTPSRSIRSIMRAARL